MAYIIVILIVAILNGCLAFIDQMLDGILPLSLYAEKYMSMVSGVQMFNDLYNIVFGFGVSLIVLKFLKKGFETYVLWTDGDADEEQAGVARRGGSIGRHPLQRKRRCRRCARNGVRIGRLNRTCEQ